MREIIRLGLMLALICGVSAAGLTAVHGTTLPLIEQQRLARKQDAMALCVPGSADCEEVVVDGRAHCVLRDNSGAIMGAATLVKVDGYGSRPMEVLVGVNTEGEILNVIILSISETPGIGTKVNTAEFRGRFVGQNITGDILIDGITGATVSSDALIAGVRQAAKVLSADFLER